MNLSKKTMNYNDVPWRTGDGGRSASPRVVRWQPLMCNMAAQPLPDVNDGLGYNTRTGGPLHTRVRELRSRDITLEFTRAASCAYMQLSNEHWIPI